MLILVLIAIALITLAIRTEVKSNRAHKKNNAHTEREPKSIEVKQYKQYSINFTKEVFNDFVSLDFETTGLSANIDKIIEVAATKYCNGKIVDEFHSLIYPEIHIPSRITKINNIDDSMVNGCPRISEIVPKLLEFIGDLPIVAHNASFDIGFLNANIDGDGYVKNKVIDTLGLSRMMYKNLDNHKLITIKEYFKMDLDSHRASDDTKVAAEIYIKYCKKIIDEVKKNDDIVFSEDELKCYEIIKDMLISENKNIEYLRYSRTGNYFDINIFYNFFRIKLTAKKHFIVSRYSMDELKAVIPDGNYELSPKSETGRTRIIIEDLNDILKFKGLILKSFDKSIKDVGYLKNNIKNGDYDINRYLMSNLK